MNIDKRQWLPTVRSLIALFAGMIILAVTMYSIQNSQLIYNQQLESERIISDATVVLDGRESAANSIQQQFTASFRADVRLAASALKIATDTTPEKLLNSMDFQLWQISAEDGSVIASSGVEDGTEVLEFRKVSTALISAPVEADGLEYYGATLTDGQTLTVGRSTQSRDEEIEESAGIYSSMFSIDIEDWDALYLLRASDGTILYDEEQVLTGQNAGKLGLSAQLTGGMAQAVRSGKIHYYAVTKEYSAADGETYMILVLTDMHTLANTSWTVCMIALLVYLGVGVLIVLYRVFALQDLRSGALEGTVLRFRRYTKRSSIDLTLLTTLRAIVAAGIALIFILSFYLSMMANVASEEKHSDVFAEKLFEELDLISENKKEGSTLEEKYMPELRKAARLLDISDKLEDSAFLTQLGNRLEAQDIYLFNTDGSLLATNTRYVDFSLDSDKTGKYYGLIRVVRGYDDTAVVTDVKSSNYMNEENNYLAIVLPSKDAILMAGYPAVDYKTMQDEQLYDSAMAVIDATENMWVVAAEKDTNKIIYVSSDELNGIRAEELGLDAVSRVPGFIGWRTLVGRYSQVQTYEYGSQIIMTATPVRQNIRSALIAALITAFVSFLSLYAACMTMVIEEITPPEDSDGRVFEIILPGAPNNDTQANRPGRFMEKMAMKKLGRVFYILSGIAMLGIVIWIFAGGMESNSILKYVISNRWDHNLNLFAITHLMMVILGVQLLLSLVRATLLNAGIMLGARGETVARMLCSFIRYAGVIAVVFYALSCFGIDSGSLLASAGVLTLMVSLGARSLIEDILAGIFIVFEGDYKKGDVVMVDGWRGTVEEIGVRTTRIRSGVCDLKVVRNSQISGIINMTGDFSVAICKIGIGYDESLERVEAILSEELPHFAAGLPASVTDLDYMGVLELADSAVVIGVCARCEESDRILVERMLNREMKLIFDRHSISIPYPQITLNQPDAHTSATPEDKKRAHKFVHGSAKMRTLWAKPRFRP